MSSRIQNKLDQETLSPVVAIFLMFLLQMAGLLEREEEVEAIVEESEKITGLALALQSDSQFIPLETQPFHLEHMSYPIPPAPLLAPAQLQYAQVSSPMVEATLVMPDGANHITVIPERLTVTWHYSDGRAPKTQAMRECAAEMSVHSSPVDWFPDAPLHISVFGEQPYNYGSHVSRIAGLCTPSRNMITCVDYPQTVEGEWIT